MSSDTDGRVKVVAYDGVLEANEDKNERGGLPRPSPPTGPVSDENNERHQYKRTDRRTGLKTTDGHATWREVYARCHVGGGVDE